MTPFIFSFIATCLLSIGVSEGANTAAVGSCPDSQWEYRNGYCYWSSLFAKDRINSWFGAARECRQKDADLVSIHSESENNFVHKMTYCAKTWTGLTIIDESKRGKAEGMQWIDGTTCTYLNWYGSGPSRDSYSRLNCFFLRALTGGQWYNAMCSTNRLYYVCKRRPLAKTLRTKRASNNCGVGWRLSGNKCLYVSNTPVDFFEAQLQCQSMGAHLLTLKSTHEEASLARALDSCLTPWLGLENTNPSKVNSNLGWKWNDNTVVGYSNWLSRIPTNDVKKQCGKLERGLSWTNVYCWQLLPFICEKMAV